jgi:hypothetical protein
MFFFVFTVLPIVGCLKNRKTNKIPVTKHRLFLFSAFVSIALVSVTTLDMLASSLSNPFIVGAYLDDNKYHDSANG